MRKLLLISCLITVGACTTPTGDMVDNDFSTVSAVSAPTNLVGRWTGSSGPYLMTISVGADGKGLSCYSWSGRQTVGRIKYDGQQLRFQDGTRLKLTLGDDRLVGRSPYTGSNDIVFFSDPNLTSADPYCSQKL